MLPADIEYYRRRASAERELARSAESADVAEIHDELARQYEALIEQEELRPIPRIRTGERSSLPSDSHAD